MSRQKNGAASEEPSRTAHVLPPSLSAWFAAGLLTLFLASGLLEMPSVRSVELDALHYGLASVAFLLVLVICNLADWPKNGMVRTVLFRHLLVPFLVCTSLGTLARWAYIFIYS